MRERYDAHCAVTKDNSTKTTTRIIVLGGRDELNDDDDVPVTIVQSAEILDIPPNTPPGSFKKLKFIDNTLALPYADGRLAAGGNSDDSELFRVGGIKDKMGEQDVSKMSPVIEKLSDNWMSGAKKKRTLTWTKLDIELKTSFANHIAIMTRRSHFNC